MISVGVRLAAFNLKQIANKGDHRHEYLRADQGEIRQLFHQFPAERKGIVKHYRKMSNQWVADETREVRQMMTDITYTILDGWGEEYEQMQAGMIDPRREILNMALEKQIDLLNQKVANLTRENGELKKEKARLQKALKKQDLNFIKNL